MRERADTTAASTGMSAHSIEESAAVHADADEFEERFAANVAALLEVE